MSKTKGKFNLRPWVRAMSKQVQSSLHFCFLAVKKGVEKIKSVVSMGSLLYLVLEQE